MAHFNKGNVEAGIQDLEHATTLDDSPLILEFLGGQKREYLVRVRVPADCEKLVVGQSGDLLPAHFLINRLVAVAYRSQAALVKHYLNDVLRLYG